MAKKNPFQYFKTSPKVIHLAVMLYICLPFSLRNVEDMLHDRGISISHETAQLWWSGFGPLFAADIRRSWVRRMCAYSNW
jgi:putative transposase